MYTTEHILLVVVCVFVRSTVRHAYAANFCSQVPVTERLPLERTIIGSCTADIGACPVGQCVCSGSNSFVDAYAQNGYICPQTGLMDVDCSPWGSREVEVVKECMCCWPEGITIIGTVVDSVTQQPLNGVQVNLNGVYITNNGLDGAFQLMVDPGTTEVAIHVRKVTGTHLDAVRVVDIPINQFKGPLRVVITMVKKAQPTQVHSEEDFKLDFFSNQGSADEVVAELVIEAGTIKRADNMPYSGIIRLSATFAGVSPLADERNIQGRFLTNDENQLQSGGMFAIDMKDMSGNPLHGPVWLKVRTGMKLWNLDTGTGRWSPAPILNRRRRRNVDLTDELLIEIEDSDWVNIDKLPDVPISYFKTRVIYQNPGDAANTPSFRPDILVYTPDNERLRLYAPSTTTPEVFCFEARSLPYDSDNPDTVLFGFVNLTAYENVIVGGYSIPVVTHLQPKALQDYIEPIKIEHSEVSYAIASNQLDTFVNYISSVDGPFYDNLASCEASTIEEPAFHFYKPELPAYEPYPDGTPLCTARILFNEEWGFYDVLEDLATLPTVSVVSTWSQGGTGYFFTDVTSLQYSVEGGEEFYYACVQHRCSTAAEHTDVYLDIDIPIVETIDPVTGDTITTEAFHCSKGCHDSTICQSPIVDGSFEAPEVAGLTGPAFYDSTMNDCPMRTKSEASAYQFWCWQNVQQG